VPAAALEGAEADVATTSGALAVVVSCDLTVLVRAVGGSNPGPSHCSCRALRVRRSTTPHCHRALGVACGVCLSLAQCAHFSALATSMARMARALGAALGYPTLRRSYDGASGPPPPQQVGHARARRIDPAQRRLSSDLRAAATATPPRSASKASGPRSSSNKKLRNSLYLSCRVGNCNNKKI
jgi:hypothetical protein